MSGAAPVTGPAALRPPRPLRPHLGPDHRAAARRDDDRRDAVHGSRAVRPAAVQLVPNLSRYLGASAGTMRRTPRGVAWEALILTECNFFPIRSEERRVG